LGSGLLVTNPNPNSPVQSFHEVSGDFVKSLISQIYCNYISSILIALFRVFVEVIIIAPVFGLIACRWWGRLHRVVGRVCAVLLLVATALKSCTTYWGHWALQLAATILFSPKWPKAFSASALSQCRSEVRFMVSFGVAWMIYVDYFCWLSW